MSYSRIGLAEPNQPIEIQPYTGMNFFQKLNADIANAGNGDKVSLVTMSFEPEESLVYGLVNHMTEAAHRGADVVFAVDNYAFMYPRGIGPVALPLPIGVAAIRRRNMALDDLRRAGVLVRIINQPPHQLASLYSGRSHLKINTVKNQIYLGGPSLHGTERSDIVVGFCHAETAEWLHELTSELAVEGTTRAVLGKADCTWQIDDITEILVDAGRPKQSLILDEAVRLVDNASEHLIIGSQYFPTGRMGRHLLKAYQRGVKVHIAHNHPSRHDRLTTVHRAVLHAQRYRGFPEEFFEHQVPLEMPKLHAKVLASEKEAIVGSHNYVYAGVRFGTSEIALIRKQPAFAESVKRLLLTQVRLNGLDGGELQ